MSCSHRNEQNESTYKPSKRGKFEVCELCQDRFPCADHGCTHIDCQQERGQTPKCHYCGDKCEGTESELWCRWRVQGSTRAVHYKCRDSRATQAELDRWY